MARKKRFEREMEEIKRDLSTPAEGCAPVPESDSVLRACDQILETLREIRSDLSKLRDRFV